MIWSRAILSALIAVAIAVAPVGLAWAGLSGHHTVKAASDQHHSGPASHASAEAMHDCASKKMGASESHLPCCTDDLVCPPEFCVAKCFQVIDVLEASTAPLLLKPIRLSAPDQVRPPDWAIRPQPPPPRS